MKPDLRKVAALLLSATTLFGGGILSANTALADDLNGLTSTTQVQADTGDNGTDSQSDTSTAESNNTQNQSDSQSDASTNDTDKNNDDASVQSDTGVKSTAPEAAQDVTIHDMLDTDAAYVSKLKLTDRRTGTAPFDDDNERGDDKDDKNDIVRSFDDVIYNYEYTVTPDSTMDYYKRTRVGFRFELPYPADKVTFDTDQMGWVDQTKGYEPKLTTETIDGVETQVYTCYRLLEPTSNSPTVNPGTSAISLAVAVKGAPNGFKFHPTVKSWTVPNDVQNRVAVDTPGDVTVSAKLNLNTRIVNYGRNDDGTFDLDSGDENAPGHGQGKVTGLDWTFNVITELRWKDKSKGLKGLEIPSGPITYQLHVSNQYKDEDGTSTHDMEERWQPILLDEGNNNIAESSTYGRNVTGTDWLRMTVARRVNGVNGYENDKKATLKGTTPSITSTTSDTGTTLTVTFDGYDALTWPTRYLGQGDIGKTCSPYFMDSQCETQQVAAIGVQSFHMLIPTSRNDKTVQEIYGKDQTAVGNTSITSLSATSVSGYNLPTAADNSNQSVTSDDDAALNVTVRLPGRYIGSILYQKYGVPLNESSLASGLWTVPQFGNGSDIALEGSSFYIGSGCYFAVQSTGTAPVMGLHLTKWDGSVLEPNVKDKTQPTTINVGYYSWGKRYTMTKGSRGGIQLKWAVKSDGKGWTNDKEMYTARIADLQYYDTVSEAEQHGIIVGALYENRDANDPDNTSLGRSICYRVDIPVRTRTGTVGKTAATVGEQVQWTRDDLHNLNPDSPAVNASNNEWQTYAESLPNLVDFLKADTTKAPNKNRYWTGDAYRKATFDENGVYKGGDTADNNRGDTLYVTGEIPHVSKSTAQTNEQGSAKTIYDIDKEQRTVDWKITATAETQATTTSDAYTTDYIITDTLPKGLTYVDGSSYVGGTYKEGTPNQGTVTGGTKITPTVTKNDDGSTTLVFRVNGAKADGGTRTNVYFSSTIGDASDPDKDVKNNDSFTNHVQIQSKRNMATPQKERGQTADATIRVSRTHSSSLATRAQPLLNDIEKTLGFTNMLGNFSNDDKTDPYAVDIMPYTGTGSSSKYSGDYTMTVLSMSGKNGASLDNVHVYFTNDVKWRNVSAEKITRQQVEQWTEAKVDKTTGTITIPDGYSKPVAWAFTSDRLPANARYDFSMAFKPSGNKAADAYINRWSDGDNKVDAITQVVERKVNGVAWFDVNKNGVRESSDRLLPDVTVTLLDKNGDTVTNVNGKPCVTTTDKNGWYELTAIPSGSGYKLRFTPKKGTNWKALNTTVKNAKDASEATDSDSDQENDADGKMVAGVIALKDFPALDEMTTAVYEDPNEDHGLVGTLKPAISATFKAVKVLNGRPNGAWTDKDKYVADITPVGDAPKSAVPSTIAFTNNKTQTFDIDSDAFTYEGTYQYQIAERKGENAGVTYDGRVWTLTVTVKDDTETLERSITANASCDGVQSDTIQFTNTYAPKDTQTRIAASKLFTNSASSSTKITDFQFDLYANDKGTGTPIQTVNATADGKVEFSPLLFTQAKLNGKDKATFHYSVRERDTGAGGVSYDTHYAVWTVTVTDDNSGQLKASLINPAVTMKDGNAYDESQFVNTYHSQPVSVTPRAKKVLTNPQNTLRLLDADEFTFQLQDTNGKVLQSKKNTANGTVTFDKISYDTVGDHDYRIVEKNGTLAGITYDQTVHTMHVNVSDNGYGQLKANVSYDDTKNVPTFTNTYQAKDVTVQLTAKKTFTNKNASHAKLSDFQFQLFDNGKGVGIPVQTVNADENGNVTFQPVTFTAQQLDGNRSKTFSYSVKEVKQAAGGVTYDSHMGLWQVTVIDDLTGQLKAQTRESKSNPTTFTNAYQAKPVSVQFRAHKTLNDPDNTGIVLKAGDYRFQCVEDATGATVGTVKTNDGNGNVVFDAVTFKKAGAYTYTISEIQGDKGGITYDTAKHHAKVDVSDNGEGQLVADITYDDGTDIPEFTNVYKAQPATDTPTAVKKVSASDGNKYTLKGGEFNFTLHQQSAPANTVNVDQTKQNDKDGNITFDTLSFPQVGTYVFTMLEQDTTVPGVSKDGTVSTITYVVKDVNHDGNLSVTSKTVKPSSGKTGKDVTFTNTYNPKDVTYTIGGVKTILNTDPATSRTPEDGEFTFQLSAVSGVRSVDGVQVNATDMPMPEGAKDGTVTTANKGTAFDFGTMSYTMPGTYTYHVKEIAGEDKTIGYSTQEYDVTVTVADNDGTLTATADKQTTDISFENTYTPTPVSVQLEASKHLTGRALNDGEFSAELKDTDGNQLQSKQFTHVARDAKNSKDATVREGTGTLTFDRLNFDHVGVYTYTMNEVTGELGGVTYDSTVHTVTITVTEDAKQHKLVASTEYSNGEKSEKSVTFENTYQPENVTVGLSAKKTMTGRELKADEFEFELVDNTGTVIDTTKNDGNGNITFQPLTYQRDNDGTDDCGSHEYVIRERNTGEKNVTYDKTEHHVTVTISDNLNGNLTATVQYDPSVQPSADSSTVASTTETVNDGEGADVSADTAADGTVDTVTVTVSGSQPEFVNSYVPPVTPAIVKAVEHLAQTGMATPILAIVLFAVGGVVLTIMRRRGVQPVTPQHRR